MNTADSINQATSLFLAITTESFFFGAAALSALKLQYQTVLLKWTVSEDPELDLLGDLDHDQTSGFVQTTADVDYTVKINANGLIPNTKYYYRFALGTKQSDLGSFWTLPVSQTENVMFPVGSCLMWPHGFYNNVR